MITPTSWPFSSYWNCAENSCCSIFIVLSIFLFLILGVERSASASIEILCCDKEHQWFCVIHLESSLNRELHKWDISELHLIWKSRYLHIWAGYLHILTLSRPLRYCRGVWSHPKRQLSIKRISRFLLNQTVSSTTFDRNFIWFNELS